MTLAEIFMTRPTVERLTGQKEALPMVNSREVGRNSLQEMIDKNKAARRKLNTLSVEEPEAPIVPVLDENTPGQKLIRSLVKDAIQRKVDKAQQAEGMGMVRHNGGGTQIGSHFIREPESLQEWLERVKSLQPESGVQNEVAKPNKSKKRKKIEKVKDTDLLNEDELSKALQIARSTEPANVNDNKGRNPSGRRIARIERLLGKPQAPRWI